MHYIPRAFWTTLILAAFTLATAYPPHVQYQWLAVPTLAVMALGCVILSFFFQPVCLFTLGMVAFTASPAGWMLGGDVGQSGHGLSPGQVALMLAALTSTLLAPRAWPMWDGNGNQRDMGPWPFNLLPILLAAFAFAAYAAGANGYFALALVAVAVTWNLVNGLMLDLAEWERRQEATTQPPDPCPSS